MNSDRYSSVMLLWVLCAFLRFPQWFFIICFIFCLFSFLFAQIWFLASVIYIIIVIWTFLTFFCELNITIFININKTANQIVRNIKFFKHFALLYLLKWGAFVLVKTKSICSGKSKLSEFKLLGVWTFLETKLRIVWKERVHSIHQIITAWVCSCSLEHRFLLKACSMFYESLISVVLGIWVFNLIIFNKVLEVISGLNVYQKSFFNRVIWLKLRSSFWLFFHYSLCINFF